MQLDVKVLDEIIKKTVSVIEKSKAQILEIAENAVAEVERVRKELEDVRRETAEVILQVDQLNREYRGARMQLMAVSSDFKRFSEEDIKSAYEKAQEIQIALVRLGEQEKSLRFRRDHLERSLKRLEATRQKAENLVSQVMVILNYLGNDLVGLSDQLSKLMQSEKMRLHIIEIMDEERRRLARDIHDGPAQALANIAIRADYCLRLLEVEPSALGKELVLLQELVRDCLGEVRQIMFDLRPMVLDDLGLVPALNKYIEQFRSRHELEVQLLCLGSEVRLNRTAEVALFRVIQEALNNALKHAGRCQVQVKLEFLDGRLNLMIRDNGCGFNVDKTLDDKENDRFGLIGMRERVRLLQGEVHFSSTPGAGTSIIVAVPLDEQRRKGQ